MSHTHGGHHLAEFSGCLYAEDFEADLRHWMNRGRTTYYSNRHRKLNFTQQVSLWGLLPSRQRLVPAFRGSEGMGASLQSPGVIARGQGDCDYAVHDSLVMGGAPIWVRGSEFVGLDDPIDDLLAPERLLGEDGLSPRQPQVSEV